ncbi:MAG TPA: sugar-binding protein [Blastocatellia bacterium]|nr:sugar-binding protein [Blastocatellia bacterium]
MNRNAKLFLGLFFAVAVLLPAGCSQKSGGTASGKKLAFVTNNASDFWTIARKGTEKADEELADATVEFKIPADGTAAEQKRIIDDLLARGFAGIAISPVDPANQTELINQTSQKALVVTQDSDAPNSQRAVYVGTDNVAAGRQAGKLLKEALPEGGKIVIFVGKLDAQNAKERLQGIEEEIAGTKIQIIDKRTDDADHARAKANAADSLVKYADAAAFVGLWSYNGPAILNAIKEANKLDKVKIICFDEEDQTLAGVKAGEIVGTVVQQPYEFGYQAIKIMNQILNGDRSGVPASKQAFVPTLIIKKDNVEDFTAKLNKLRGR